jgi:hypothetical protein
MLLAVDLDEHLVDIEGVAITSVLPPQSSRVQTTEFDAPWANRFSADGYAPLSQEIFNIAVTQIEAIV